MNSMRLFSISALTCVACFLCSCYLFREPPPKRVSPFVEFLDRTKDLKANESLVGQGVIDYKSICLNLLSKPRKQGNICEVFLSEHAGGNTESILLDLNVCSAESKSSCIDPLPENAPPEVIIIRDKWGYLLEPWQQLIVVVEKAPNKQKLQIKQIHSP